jgi:hypothetical protein
MSLKQQTTIQYEKELLFVGRDGCFGIAGILRMQM